MRKKEKLRLKQEFYDKVYTILVKNCAAVSTMREPFVVYHMDESIDYHEWRFSGMLGFGGKYRKYYNRIDYYVEDRTDARDKLVDKVNGKLDQLKLKYKEALR